jgi:hypothetical protein
MSRWHIFLGNRCGADLTSFVIQLTRMHQVKPPNRLAFRAPRPKAARQAVFKIYPFIKARVTTLRNDGIKPTLKRIIFLKKTLMKYQALLSPDERQNSDSVVVGSSVNSLGLLTQDFIASVSQSSDPAAAPGVSARIFTGTVTSASTLLHAPPALLLLTAVQLGHTVNLLPTHCSTTVF